MTRISPVTEDLAALRAYRLPDGRPMELFRACARNPAVLDDLRRATTTCLRDLGLPVRDREIVILRTLARSGAEAEWALHVALFAAEAGLSAAELAGLCGTGIGFPGRAERDLIELADVCHDRDGRVDEETWHRWRARRPDEELLALLTVAGQYRKVALLTNALGLAAPDGLPGFPSRAERLPAR